MTRPFVSLLRRFCTVLFWLLTFGPKPGHLGVMGSVWLVASQAREI